MKEKQGQKGKLINSVIKLDMLTHRNLKVFAAKRGITLNGACIELIRRGLSQERD